MSNAQQQEVQQKTSGRSSQLGIDGEALVNLPPELPIVIDEQAVEDILGVSWFCSHQLCSRDSL